MRRWGQWEERQKPRRGIATTADTPESNDPQIVAASEANFANAESGVKAQTTFKPGANAYAICDTLEKLSQGQYDTASLKSQSVAAQGFTITRTLREPLIPQVSRAVRICTARRATARGAR